MSLTSNEALEQILAEYPAGVTAKLIRELLAARRVVEALRESASQHRIIAGLDVVGASSVAYNAARSAEYALSAYDQACKSEGDG